MLFAGPCDPVANLGAVSADRWRGSMLGATQIRSRVNPAIETASVFCQDKSAGKTDSISNDPPATRLPGDARDPLIAEIVRIAIEPLLRQDADTPRAGRNAL